MKLETYSCWGCILSQFLCVSSPGMTQLSLLFRASRGFNQGVNKAKLYSKTWDPLPSSCNFWQNSFSCYYRSMAPCFLLAIIWELLLALRGNPWFQALSHTFDITTVYFFKLQDSRSTVLCCDGVLYSITTFQE